MDVEIGYHDADYGYVNINFPRGCDNNHQAWAAEKLALKIASAVAQYNNECANLKGQDAIWENSDEVTWWDASGDEVEEWEDWDTVTTFQCAIFKTKKGE